MHLPTTFTKTGNQMLPLQVIAKTLQPKGAQMKTEGARFKQDYKEKNK